MVNDGKKRAVGSLFDVSRVTGANEASADNDKRDGVVGIKGRGGIAYIIILISVPEGRDHIKPADKEREGEKERRKQERKTTVEKNDISFMKTDHDPAIALGVGLCTSDPDKITALGVTKPQIDFCRAENRQKPRGPKSVAR